MIGKLLKKTSTLMVVSISVAIIALIVYFTISGGSSDTDTSSENVKSITIKLTETQNEAKEWVPDLVYLKVGDKVELTVVNGDDDDEHRLSIPDLGIETIDIPGANERDTVTFTVDKVGTFTFVDYFAPDWESEICKKEVEGQPQGDQNEFICVPPGQFIVEE